MNREKPSELERKKIIGRAVFQKQYLEKANLYSKITIEKDDLLSVEETAKILNISREINRSVVSRLEFPFSNKEAVVKAIGEFERDADAPYYMFLEHCDFCGLIVLPTIWDFNFDFKYEDDPDGIVSIARTDLKKGLLLDYGEGNSVLEDGGRYICLEFRTCNEPIQGIPCPELG